MNKTHENILNSAIKLILENGYSGTSIQMIAENVGVSKSTVIHYFKNKEGILLSVLNNFLPTAIENFKSDLENKTLSGFEKLRRFIRFHMKLISDSGDILTININETRYLSKKSKSILQKHQKDYEGMVAKIIYQILDENEKNSKDMNPMILTKAVIGMCNSAMIWFSAEGLFSVDDISEQLFELVAIDGIRAI
ncbi:TetR/AcrR family transcriptional regulator [Malonomonas rubra]|uniref:TetR/AcrR family transcriptional regulator n=1 Tax=Malonomonas rubra TaxID=57040 RepID=UPI0026E93CFF|nr:TetR/AcrR family transcriptional regulator [Malonomonas rubra]